MPSAYGPRSRTVHCAVAPFDAWIVTTVPIGNVLWAHVPGGAASYQVAPPLCVRPDGAGAAEPDPDDAGLGAGLAGAAAGLAAAVLSVVVVRRGVVEDVVRSAAGRTRAATAVDDVDGGTVVGGSVVTVVASPPVAWSGGSASRVETATSPART